MRYYWITNINEFIKLKDDWDKALKTSKADRPYLLSDLIITWWDIYKKGKRLQIFILMNEQDVIVAGFPLYIMRSHIKKGGFRRIMQIGDGFANYTEPFYSIDVNLFRKFFIMAINELRGWEIIFLPSIKIDFIGIENEIYKSYEYDSLLDYDTNAVINIYCDADTYLMSRGQNLRHNVKRYRAKAKAIGEISLLKINKVEEIVSFADLYIQFSIESRKKRGSKSSFEDSLKAEFLRKISKVFANQDRVDLHVLRFGEEIAAITFGWRYGDGYKYILTSYNPKLSHIHIGYILTYELLNYAYNNKDSYFDMFGGGGVFYKKDWCNSFSVLYNLILFNNSIFGAFAHQALKIKNRIKTKLNEKNNKKKN